MNHVTIMVFFCSMSDKENSPTPAPNEGTSDPTPEGAKVGHPIHQILPSFFLILSMILC